MQKVSEPGHIRVLKQDVAINQVPVQAALFPHQDSRILVFLEDRELTEDLLVSILSSMHPKWFFDFRPVPNFDLGTMNRRIVFSELQRFGCSYHDIGGLLGVHRSAAHNPVFLAEIVNPIFSSDPKRSYGPIIFLFSDNELKNSAFRVLPGLISPAPKDGWVILIRTI